MKKLRIILIAGLIALTCGILLACGAQKLPTPENLNIVNKTLSWNAVENARGYTVEIDGVEHDVRRVSYNFESAKLAEGTYTFKVKARGNEVDFSDSDWATIQYVQGYESGMTYELNDRGNGYVIKSVGSANGDIVIEDTYNGLPVTEVGDFAFTNSLDVKSVTLGENVTKIGTRAFYGCTEMKSVTLSDKLTEIGEMTFQSCHSLTEITIPDNVRSIGVSAFAYCKNLEKVELGKNVTVIGDSAFKNCFALNSITIPESVESIGSEAFYKCDALASVAIRSAALTVGASAFRNCASLNSVDFGNCAMEISDAMFAECTSLAGLTVPATVTSIGDGAFMGCVSLAEVTIGSGVKRVGYNAFFNTAVLNDSQEKIYILDKWIVGTSNSLDNLLRDEDLTAIYNREVVGTADYAFYGCVGLYTVRLPASLKYVGKGTFSNCTSLLHAIVGDNAVTIGEKAFYNCDRLLTVTLGLKVETIGPYAFGYCANLTKDIIIPDSVTSIGTYAFYHTLLWNEVTGQYATGDGIMYAGKWVVGCNQQKESLSVEVKSGTVGLADYAFAYSKMVMIELPDSVKYIGEGAFYSHKGMDMFPVLSTNIPQGVTEIKPFTFYGANIGKITIPNSVKKIDYAAFGGSGLNGITIPDSVTEIGSYAFWACKYLEMVTMSKNVTEIADCAFSSCDRLLSITIPSGVTSIGRKAFFRCQSLASVNFEGEMVTEIGDKAFYMCTNLRSMKLPDSVTGIRDYAFYKCQLMKEIKFNDRLASIGDYAFYGCQSLTSLKLPDSVTSIGNSAFRYCKALRQVILGRYLTDIGEHAFYGIKGVTLYCEAPTLPEGWMTRWNSSYRPVVLGCTLDENSEYIVSVQKTDKSLYNYGAENGISGPARAGYKFLGWATSPDGAPEYGANAIHSAPDGMLYAVWEEGEEDDDPTVDPGDDPDAPPEDPEENPSEEPDGEHNDI